MDVTIPLWGLVTTFIMALGGIVTALLAIWKTRNYAPHETLKLDAETFKTLTESNQIAATTSTKAWERCGELESRISELHAKITSLNSLVMSLTTKYEMSQAKNTILETEVKELYDENFKLKKRVLHLEYVLREHGIDPMVAGGVT
jgi:peptidoglycan hydrolase CwlO-like protein